MYGTIFRMKVKPGKEQEVAAISEEWEREIGPKVKGAIAGYTMKPDNTSGVVIGVAVFADKESYLANANNPDQHTWYAKLRDLLEEDPQWEDGEYLSGPSS